MIRRSIMNKLKYGIILTAVLFAQSVFAYDTTQTTLQVESYVTNVQPLQQETRKIVKPIKTCSVVEVPIYGTTGGAQTGNVLGGAIIGGILGNQVGGGKGKDAATILGAILGADFANKKSGTKTIVGYKRTTVCEDNPTFVTEIKKVYEYSIIRFSDDNNRQYEVKFIADNK